MTNDELVGKMAARLGTNPISMKNLISVLVDEISKALVLGDIVNVAKLGDFYVSRLEARNGSHPKTQVAIAISASNRVRFKPSQSIRIKVN